MNEIILQGQHGLTEHCGSSTLATRETASSAVAAQAQAAVQARYVMAINRPRNMDVVRQVLLKECRRSSFAKVARYHKPIGKGVEGLSIRFVEAAIRSMTNILVETSTIYDDQEKRIVRVTVTDLETNATYHQDKTIAKTVERKNLQKGQKPISQRVNSKGELTYTVEATDDDIMNKENAIVSKAIRTCGLRLIPGDLSDECECIVKETLRSDIEQDPDAEKKRIADVFAGLNIHPDQLSRFIGCDLGQASPDQLVTLRALYTALKDGEVTIADLLDQTRTAQEGEKKPNKLQNVLERRRKEITEKKINSQDQEPVTEKRTDDQVKQGPTQKPAAQKQAQSKKSQQTGRDKESQSYEPPTDDGAGPLLDWNNLEDSNY